MQYFTYAWWSGQSSSGSAASDYEAHLRSVRPRLPAGAIDILDHLDFHDSHLLTLAVDPERAEVRLDLDVISPSHGGDRIPLRLTYSGVITLHQTSYRDNALGGPGGLGDLGYDEWHITSDGGAEHRLLFSSGAELHIRFKEVAVSTRESTAGA
jgi:hypothetical protein